MKELEAESLPELCGELNQLHGEIESDMQRLDAAALMDGVLVVTSFPESIDLSWLLCCSVPGMCKNCRKGVFARDPQGKIRVVCPRTPAGRPRTDRRR